MKLNITKENRCPATGQQQKYKVHQNRTSQQVPLGGGKNSDSAPCGSFKHGEKGSSQRESFVQTARQTAFKLLCLDTFALKRSHVLPNRSLSLLEL